MAEVIVYVLAVLLALTNVAVVGANLDQVNVTLVAVGVFVFKVIGKLFIQVLTAEIPKLGVLQTRVGPTLHGFQKFLVA